MTSLSRIVAAHPLVGREPYRRIKFSRVDGNGTPLYKVGHGRREFGASLALRTAYERFGGHCFHCGGCIVSAEEFTLDHIRPHVDGGEDRLHNLVFACKSCNRAKAADDLVSFRPAGGAEYMRALDEHLVRCLNEMRKRERK